MYAFQNIPRSDISNMRESASLKYPNSEKSIKKTLGAAEFFLINFKVFRYLMKCSFRVFGKDSETINNS